MSILLKTASVRVSSIQIMEVRVQNKGKSVWKSRYDGDVSVWVSRGMARPAMEVRWGGEACAAAEPGAGRREQVVPPALV